jgi:hypothetical protein
MMHNTNHGDETMTKATYEVVTNNAAIPQSNFRAACKLARYLCGNGHAQAWVERVVESYLLGNPVLCAYRQIGGRTVRVSPAEH